MKNLKLLIPILAVIALSDCAEINETLIKPLPEKVTYIEHIKPIFDQSCIRCHGESEKIMNLNLSSYTEIEKRIGTDVSAHLIVPGDAHSYLLRIVKPGGGMYRYLNDQFDYELIKEWVVANGAR